MNRKKGRLPLLHLPLQKIVVPPRGMVVIRMFKTISRSSHSIQIVFPKVEDLLRCSRIRIPPTGTNRAEEASPSLGKSRRLFKRKHLLLISVLARLYSAHMILRYRCLCHSRSLFCRTFSLLRFVYGSGSIYRQ